MTRAGDTAPGERRTWTLHVCDEHGAVLDKRDRNPSAMSPEPPHYCEACRRGAFPTNMRTVTVVERAGGDEDARVVRSTALLTERSGGDEAAGGEEVIRQAIYDPGRFVKRDFEWGEPRWEGDSAAYEPLHVWQTRAVLAALAPAGSPEAPEPEEFDAICRATLGHELDGETVAEAAVRLIERATAPAVSEREVREDERRKIVEALRDSVRCSSSALVIEAVNTRADEIAREFGVALDEEAADGE